MQQQTPQKATPVEPPTQPGVVEVNMNSVFTALWMMSMATSGLAISTTLLWRKIRRNEEYLEAIREYTSRLVKHTDCGRLAYESLTEEFNEKEAPVTDWSDQGASFPQEEEEEQAPSEDEEKEATL